MLQKFTPVANLPMVRGGARNLLDGSKCASIGHILGVYRQNIERKSGYAFEHSRDYVLANPGAAAKSIAAPINGENHVSHRILCTRH